MITDQKMKVFKVLFTLSIILTGVLTTLAGAPAAATVPGFAGAVWATLTA